MKKARFYIYVYDFFVDYDNINIRDITNVHNYLMNKHNTVWISGFNKQMFIILVIALLCFDGSLADAKAAPGSVNCVAMSTQQCMVTPTLMDLYLDESF